ncbi:hypothetical protein ASZ78_005898, partial [Callipepla squamata]
PSVIVHTILLMGQRGGHQESWKKLEISPSETMKAEEENSKEEDRELKSKDCKLLSVFGAADLRNGNHVLSFLCTLNFLALTPSVPFSVLGLCFLLYRLTEEYADDSHFALPKLLSVPSTSAPSGVLSNIPPLCCLVTIGFTSLYRITVPVCATQKMKNVPYQMLLLLEQMQRGKQKAVSPRELALCLVAHRVKQLRELTDLPSHLDTGTEERNSCNAQKTCLVLLIILIEVVFSVCPVFVQYDAAQLFLTIWNLLKKQLKNLELVGKLSDLYTLCVQEHLVCQMCSSETKRNSSMLTLPVPLLDPCSHKLKTLEECLQCFFHPEELTGQNMCFCEHCGKKTPFLQVSRSIAPNSPLTVAARQHAAPSVFYAMTDVSVKLVRLPQTLTIHLKRFCFGRSAYIHKLSDCLPFPQDLDFNAVLTEQQCEAYDNEKDSWQYELFAVVAHSGSISSGHYCAYIRSLTECKWYCFNDSIVNQVRRRIHVSFVAFQTPL